MSLWPASDQTSAVIMEAFYRKLLDGLPKEEALHQAKLEYLANADPLSAHPYFWGNFVLIGNTNPVHFPSMALQKMELMLLVLLAAGLCCYIWIRRQVYYKAFRLRVYNAQPLVQRFKRERANL